MKPRLSVVTIAVDDLEKALAFYRDGLGLATEGIVGTKYPNGAVAFFDLQAGLKLALWPRRSLAAETGLAPGTPSATEILLSHNVASEAEVDQIMARAVRAGARVLKVAGPAFWGGYAGYFQDPDGHAWEIAYNPKWPDPGD